MGTRDSLDFSSVGNSARVKGRVGGHFQVPALAVTSLRLFLRPVLAATALPAPFLDLSTD